MTKHLRTLVFPEPRPDTIKMTHSPVLQKRDGLDHIA